MKVLFFSAYPQGEAVTGGVEAACTRLAEALAAIGHTVEVISVKAGLLEIRRELRNGVFVHHVPCVHHLPVIGHRFERPLFFYQDYRFLCNYVRLRPLPDIIHGQGLGKEGYLATKVARALGIPAVITVHGMVDIETLHYWGGRLRSQLARWTMQRTLSAADGVIFVSPYRQEELQEFSKGLVCTIENPVADGFFEIQGGQKKELVLFAGVLIRRKRIHDLLRAFRLVADRIPRAHLRLVGPFSSSPYERAYRKEIQAICSQLGGRVTFAAQANCSAMRCHYREARLLVLASEQETAPVVISEAMAAGVPVVATRVGGIPWMVQDGENGYLVEVGDVEELAERIVELLTNQERWEAFSRCAKTNAERFRASNVAAQTLEAYQQILRSASLGGA